MIIMKNLFRILFSIALFASITLISEAQQRPFKQPGLQDTLLLKDYRPKSIFRVPETKVLKAKYPAIDMHMHAPRGENTEALAKEVLKAMDETGVEKTIIFCGTGETFDRNAAAYGKYPDRFELWCGLDFTGIDKPGFGPATIAELERCVKLGAKGVGEVHDKGMGLGRIEIAKPMHINDPRMDPVLTKMADLGLPFNFHVGDPKWMYEPMDETNDLLWEAYHFRLDNQNVVGLEDMLLTLEDALRKHPRLIFITPHFANLTYNLAELGRLFDKYPNLYADISQREAYVGSIPRYAKEFMEKYADRLLWGTDQGYSLSMYRNSFRIWETYDDHFYAWDVSNSPWVLYGVGLNDVTLRKIYRKNALKILKR
jgi:uncharacterized protein